MIREAIAELDGLAQRVTSLHQTQLHGQALTKRQQAVDMMVERALRARRSSDLLAARLESEGPFLAPSTSDARAQIATWRAALDADLAGALAGDSFATFNDTVLKAIGDLETHTASLWQRYVSHHAPETPSEVLEALANDPRARVAVVRIRRLAEQLRQLRDRTVPSTAEIDEFDTAAHELHETWATLDVEGLDPDVVRFLRAANSERGAPLASLTEPVVAWLADRDASTHYVIKPAD